jgi:hypothetical protein
MTRQRPDRPVTRLECAAAYAAIAAGALFGILLLGLHVLEPEYDPTWRFLSEYALGRFGWLMTAAFLAIAAGGRFNPDVHLDVKGARA